MINHRPLSLPRTTSCNTTTSTAIIPYNYISSTPFITTNPTTADHTSLTGKKHSTARCSPGFFKISTFIRSIVNVISIPTLLPSCRWFNFNFNFTLPTHLSLTPSPSRKVTGTLFGNRRGHVTFAVQHDSRSDPVLVIELAVTTASLVKEMSSGLVRIALECEKQHELPGRGGAMKLFREPMWSMYCNGRKCGYAQTRGCSESDWHVLRTVETISVGAGVIPVVDEGKGKGKGEGELLYMRARFERVVGSRDSEAFYMMNPDGSGGPELSIFLLRI